MELAGTTALITGAGGGIGAGIAQALAEKGARVVLADVCQDWVAEQAAAIKGEVLAVELDVTSPTSWQAAKSLVEAAFGPVDILCNNAGISTPRMALDEVSAELFARIFAVNVMGVHHGIAAFAPDMKARRSGHIVNTSSVNGLLPFGSFTTYSASKFAVTALSEGLRDELAPFGVGVSILYPGLSRSRMALDPEVGVGGGKPITPEMEAAMMDPIWLGRAVAEAIETNRMHIITHPHFLPMIDARHARLISDFGLPAQPGYGAG